MQFKIELLKKGDTVLNVWDNKIAIKHKNEDVEIFLYEFDVNGLPRLINDSILITKGDGVIKAVSDDGTIEVGTF